MSPVIGISQQPGDYRPLLDALEPDLDGVTDAVTRWCKATPANLNTKAAWCLWLAKIGHEPAGVTELFRTKCTPEGVLWLGWTGVAPKFRRMGIGGKLFDFAADEAARLGAHTLRLFVEKDAKPAQAMYRAKGMEYVSTVREFLPAHNEDAAVISGDECLVFDLPLLTEERARLAERRLAPFGFDQPLEAGGRFRERVLKDEVVVEPSGG